MLYDDLVPQGEYICHYGVKGMRWGVRHERQKTGRKTKRQENIDRHKKLAKELQNKSKLAAKQTTKKNSKLSFDSLEWKSDPKFKGMIHTTHDGLYISMFTDSRFFEMNKDTCTELLNNWNKTIDTTNKASNDYITERFTNAGFDMGESNLSGFWIGGGTADAQYDNDYGTVNVEINPRTQQVISSWYDD